MTDKSKFLKWLKVVLVLVLAACAIVPNVALWNVRSIEEARTVVDGFVIFWSILNFVVEAAGIYFFSAKVLFKKKDE